MCPLQITNRHLTPIIDPSWGKRDIYPPPVQCQNYSNGHKSETGQPNQKKKIIHPSYIFLHLSAKNFLKIQNTHRYSCQLTFLTSGQSALNGPPNGPTVIWSKIQNRLSRAP